MEFIHYLISFGKAIKQPLYDFLDGRLISISLPLDTSKSKKVDLIKKLESITWLLEKDIVEEEFVDKDSCDMKKLNKCSAMKQTIEFVKEPRWSKREKRLFWTVISEYITHLLSNESLHPEHDIELMNLDPTSEVDFRFCHLCIREDLWCGRYSLAVSNYVASIEYFEYIIGENVPLHEQHEDIRKIFIS